MRTLIALLTASLALACHGRPTGSASAEAEPSRGSAASSATQEASGPVADAADLTPGFVVWESNREGAWRLWRHDLGPHDLGSEDLGPEDLGPDDLGPDDLGPEDLGPHAGAGSFPLTPPEPGRAHCCAHISPDGRRLSYLSLPLAEASYPRSGATGELRLLALPAPGETATPSLGETRVSAARTYFEHRAAVWRSADELIYIDGEGRTVLLDLEGDVRRVLQAQTADAHGWLVDASLSFATKGEPTFSPFAAATGAVDERANLGGCQPYFSGDGRLGVWVAGAGGPIRAFELSTRRQWPLLKKGDPRLPADRRYLYFPMPSRDGGALAWAASADEHDHTRADYDVFVAETDAETLELIGPPVRLSRDPATDRFPDVWLRPLELGRHAGEAPFTVTFEGDGGGTWSFELGDGATATGAAVTHTFDEAGSFRVLARRDDEVRRGVVRVAAAAPPQPLSSEARASGREVWIRFDEPVEVGAAEAALAGASVRSNRLEDGETTWVLELETPLERPSQLTVRGVRDRAQPPNVLDRARLTVEPPRWPAALEDLVFLWHSARHQNRVSGVGGPATTLMEPVGRAFTDRHGAVVLRGGALQADVATMDRLYHGLRATNEFTLELSFTSEPTSPPGASPGVLFGFGAGGRRNLTVVENEGRLQLLLRTPTSGDAASRPVADLGSAPPGGPHHLLVTYAPGRLRAFLDGRESEVSGQPSGGFFHWRRTYLRLGGEGPVGDADPASVHWPWHGRLEGVAVYRRALGAEEALEHHRRYRDFQTRRDAAAPVPSIWVRGKLLRRSRLPTLEEIAPYREALAVFDYEVLEAGPPGTLSGTVRVAHRVLLAGEPTPIARLDLDREIELQLEPLDAQPQLEALVLSGDTPEASGPLFWSESLGPDPER